MLILIAGATFLSTLLGGLLALKFRDRLHLILGFSAGAVLGVTFFDLLPEAIELSSSLYEPSTVLSLVAVGFFFFMILDRLALVHAHGHGEHEEDCENTSHKRGFLGALSFSFHSLLDGLAIGLAFQISGAVGAVVAAAVLAHKFSDGINTVNVISKNGGEKKRAFKWLIAASIAPVIGIAISQFFVLQESTLGLVLSIFAGFFLYIGASDLLPESHHAHPKFITIIATLLGATVLYFAVKLAGI